MYNTISEIKVGKPGKIPVLVKSITTHRARNGVFYQKVHVRDQTGMEATFMQFDAQLDVQTPLIMEINVECTEYGANASFKIQQCAETTKYSMELFLPKANINRSDGWNKVVKMLKPLRSGICRVLCSVLSENKNKFVTLPLNPTGAFARQSGILEATIKLASLAEKTAEQDKRLDHDLMVAGALLYYCGHMETVDEGYEHTLTDLMYGSALSSYTVVQMKAAELICSSEEARSEIDSKDIMLLSHMLAVKNGMIKPAIPEASALKYLDQMIQEVDAMNNLIDAAPDVIVEDPIVRNRRLYNRNFENAG